MDLIVDIGNTNITFALFEEQQLIETQRFSSRRSDFSEDYESVLTTFLKDWLGVKIRHFQRIIIASVVPLIEKSVLSVLVCETGIEPLLLKNDSIPDLDIQVDNVEEIGIDRLINAYAGYQLYRRNLIIVDLGTATTFDVVTEKGVFLGGVITPGLKLSLNALIRNTGRLPEVELKAPERIVGKNTRHCIQSGITFGYTAMIEGMIGKISRELQLSFSVVITGGLSHIVNDLTDHINWIEKDLTLIGLQRILNNVC